MLAKAAGVSDRNRGERREADDQPLLRVVERLAFAEVDEQRSDRLAADLEWHGDDRGDPFTDVEADFQLRCPQLLSQPVRVFGKARIAVPDGETWDALAPRQVRRRRRAQLAGTVRDAEPVSLFRVEVGIEDHDVGVGRVPDAIHHVIQDPFLVDLLGEHLTHGVQLVEVAHQALAAQDRRDLVGKQGQNPQVFLVVEVGLRMPGRQETQDGLLVHQRNNDERLDR